MVFLTIVAVLAVLLLTGTVLHATYYKSKRDKIAPYGQMVQVYDGQMHLYRLGSGDKTVVLLPGMGTALPCADFGPVMRQLSDRYTTVCVEYFGVGFSSGTSRERTTANYVEEIRTALANAGLKPPYVLMPHSISSVYSEYYAAQYPDEVEAIISLDGTSTAYVGEAMPGFAQAVLGAAKVQQATGLTSLLAPLTVKRAESYAEGYTQKELDDLVTFAGFSINDTVLAQMRKSTTFVKDANETDYPASVPYFKVISRQTYETKNSQLPMSPQDYQRQHLARVGAQEHYEILEGTHFIYQNNAAAIRDLTVAFLSTLS